MNPGFFGTGARRLFGIYHPPSGGQPSDRGIVLCAPWGVEYLMSHRSLRQLASMLTTRGIHVLRFDYFGTGDSAGDASDASLGGCETDIETAIGELIEIGRVKHVGLVGLRLGADLAARVCARGARSFRELVLWDPVIRGRDYLLEGSIHRNGTERGSADRSPDARHASGFAMSEAFAAELGDLDLLEVLDRLPPRSLLATSEPRAALAELRDRWTARTPPLPSIHVDGPIPWREEGNLGMASIPADMLQTITEWLAA